MHTLHMQICLQILEHEKFNQMKQIQKNKRTNSIPMGSALAWNFNTIFNFMEAFINKGYAAFLSALLVTITSHHRLSLTQINSITN